MKLKVRSPRFPRELLLPLFIFLYGPFPVLLPLYVLSTLLGIRPQPKRLSELTLLFEPH
jgi:hypothetical protein